MKKCLLLLMPVLFSCSSTSRSSQSDIKIFDICINIDIPKEYHSTLDTVSIDYSYQRRALDYDSDIDTNSQISVIVLKHKYIGHLFPVDTLYKQLMEFWKPMQLISLQSRQFIRDELKFNCVQSVSHDEHKNPIRYDQLGTIIGNNILSVTIVTRNYKLIDSNVTNVFVTKIFSSVRFRRCN